MIPTNNHPKAHSTFRQFIFSLLGGLFLFFSFASSVSAGALILSPTSGAFTVGSTFDVQILLDTEGKSVNALDVDLRFPPDRIQLVSPKTNLSIISVWTSQPKFNNATGEVRLQGGIPKGINVNNALVATLTFRVKSVGNAIVRFSSDNSKILLNDGQGTNDLSHQDTALYLLTLPPPAGPIVVSETHPNQSLWYTNSSAILSWGTSELVQNFSYIFNTDPVALPDDVGEGKRSQIIQKNIPDGRYYFHIKSFRDGAWGGVTHFAINIDTTPPALFPIAILPAARTSVREPIIKFSTTDESSGVDHYELKIVNLKPNTSEEKGNQSLFIEVESPYVSQRLDPGVYDVFVRAYDKAGNYQEVIKRLNISDAVVGFTSEDGLIIGSFAIPWALSIILLLLLIALLVYGVMHYKRKHDTLEAKRATRELPDQIRSQLEELKRYKSKYGTVAIAFAFVGLSLLSLVAGGRVYAADDKAGTVELAPPYVTTISKNVSNNEIFYIGGKTENKDTAVTIFSQNISTGETTSYEVTSDKKGEWFYRHNTFLSPGKYILWTQARLGDISSPPSSQIEMNVARAAIVFGVTRVSYESLYLAVVSILVLVVVGLLILMLYHAVRAKRKHKVVLKEVNEAQEALRRGFAVLRRDIEREIEMLKRDRVSKDPTQEERSREEELRRDLKDIEDKIGREIWDIERLEVSAV